jgi:hypothetical protein
MVSMPFPCLHEGWGEGGRERKAGRVQRGIRLNLLAFSTIFLSSQMSSLYEVSLDSDVVNTCCLVCIQLALVQCGRPGDGNNPRREAG